MSSKIGVKEPDQAMAVEAGTPKGEPVACWRNASGRGVKVGVLDTGVDSEHQGLKGVVVTSQDVLWQWGRTVVRKRPRGIDYDEHGTACAGLIHEVAPEAELHSVCVLGRNRKRLRQRLIAGLEWARQQDWDVINVSLGCPEPDERLEEVIGELTASGTIVIAAKSNLPSEIGYPAAYDGVISVDMEHFETVPAWRASELEGVDVEASGVYLRAPRAWGGWNNYTGSSFACPIIAGVAARFREVNPEGDGRAFREFLREHSG